ncbi:MAG: hypothetical protein F4X02_10590 [Chloroflexi bacterium]|nr:hypothetical protein [Chloroflexota bacterium]
MASSSEIQTHDLLDAVTARIQNGDGADDYRERSESPPELSALVGTIQALHQALTPVEPRPEFVESLRADLIAGRPGVVARVQRMPRRISLAAALALVAGCLLIFLRRLFDSEPPPEIQEEAVATPL